MTELNRLVTAFRNGDVPLLDDLLAEHYRPEIRDFPVATDEARIAPQYFCGKPTGRRVLLVLRAQRTKAADPAGTHDGIRDGAGVSRVITPPKRKEYALPADLLDAMESL